MRYLLYDIEVQNFFSLFEYLMMMKNIIIMPFQELVFLQK